jgi:hypothetical protein
VNAVYKTGHTHFCKLIHNAGSDLKTRNEESVSASNPEIDIVTSHDYIIVPMEVNYDKHGD